jgi:hypothetical protein
LLVGNLLVCDADPSCIPSSIPSALFTESCFELGTMPDAGGTVRVLEVFCSLLVLIVGLGVQWWEGSSAVASLSFVSVFSPREAV